MIQFRKEENQEVSFRDRLTTIDEKGKRVWVYAKMPRGRLTRYRILASILLLAFFFAGPFLKINGEPLLLMNFMERRFIVLGVQFWPQDFHLFFLAMISMAVFIILFTVVYGRVFCGWACPQTIFMEMIYRRIEWLIEGSPREQKLLGEQPWNLRKVWKKSLKHGIFYIIAFIISNFFLAYIIGIEQLRDIITDDPRNHLAGLAGMIVFSGVFYFVFAWFREQVCAMVCPYGRLQGVLLDRNSIVVAYDHKRGEPRGTYFKGEKRAAAGKGDCINCTQCVQVCPTGIDIRNGTQLECIHCTACIDACTAMMKAVNQPPGLIRYASERSIAEGSRIKFNGRAIAYSVVLAVLLGVIVYALAARKAVEVTILRAPGTLYQEQPDNRISNLYHIKLINKTSADLPVSLRLLSGGGEIRVIGEMITARSRSVSEGVFFIFFDRSQLLNDKTPVELGVFSGDQRIKKVRSVFTGPRSHAP
jgi:cytochrome c oxidase accessory protein FixG